MRRALIGLTLLCAFSSSASALSEPLPAALEPWRDWVQHAHPELPCPLLQGQNQRLCAWPGRFEFNVEAGRAIFSGSVQTYAQTDFPLPGSNLQWPEQVQVDGQPVPVIAGSSGPQIRLEAGNWQIEGVIEFERRPEEVSLPEAYALIGLRLDQQTVEAPRRTPGGLWLGRQLNESNPQADSLSVEVYRLLADDAPPNLRTVLRLNVAGRAREQRLSGVLPEHFAYTDVRSALNARLDGNDVLLQLRPGSFEVAIDARATQPLEQIAPAVAVAPWPSEEIWSYAANAGLRESSATAATPIDPAQADVPEAWRAYASFLLSAEQPLSLSFGNRGIGSDEPNRLRLERQLWLSFDAKRWIAKDRINGSMRSGWRLDAQPPFALTRASSQGEAVLVTQQGERTGVELRSPNVDLESSAEAAYGGALPASGWASDFESLSVRMELPPGWRLLHLGGADRTSDTWVARFDLLHIGVLLVIAVLSWRLGGWQLALVLTGLGVLGRGEWGEPTVLLAGLLVLISVLVKLPKGRKRHLGTLSAWLLLVLGAWASMGFVVQQTTLAVFPQQERLDLSGSKPRQTGWNDRLSMAELHGNAGAAAEVQVVDLPNATNEPSYPQSASPVPPPPPPPAPLARSMISEEKMVKGGASNQVQRARSNLERYSAGINVQAGKAEPEWRWIGHVAGFDGRVSANAQLVPWLLSPALNSLWRLSAALLTLIALLLLLRILRHRGSLPTGKHWLWLSASLLCVSSVSSLQAAELPDGEWLQRIEARLLEAESCREAGCASMPRATVQIDDGQLLVVIDAHAQAPTALPIPELVDRPWSSAQIDGRSTALRHHNGQTWLVVDAGIHAVQLRATIDSASQQRLRFRLMPARVSCNTSGFVCSGITEGRLQSDTLELTPEASEASGSSTTATRNSIPSFVRIERDFAFELDWEIQTTVIRLAPSNGGLTVRVPLLEGEQLLSEGLEQTDGFVAVSLRSGESSVSFSSRIAPVSGLELRAAPWTDYAEVWRLRPGPAWRLTYSGVPAVEPVAYDNEWVHHFYPLPGEQLTLQLERPAAAAGSTLAIDRLKLRTVAGARQRDHVLSLSLRSTQGGQHQIQLPEAAELTAVRINGSVVPVRMTDGVLKFPVRPGAQNLQVEFRDDDVPAFRQSLPQIGLNAPASNVLIELQPAKARWLLWTQGPALGPTLGVWLLLSVCLLVLALGKYWGWLPQQVGWSGVLLLALGSVVLGWWSIPVLLALAGLLGWQQRLRERLMPWPARVLAVATALAVLFVVPLLALGWLAAISSSPQLHIGNLYSSLSGLYWFADVSEAQLPQVTVYSLPIWVYRAVLLLWGVCLAWTLYQWLGATVRSALAGWSSRRQAAQILADAPVQAPEGRM